MAESPDAFNQMHTMTEVIQLSHASTAGRILDPRFLELIGRFGAERTPWLPTKYVKGGLIVFARYAVLDLPGTRRSLAAFL